MFSLKTAKGLDGDCVYKVGTKDYVLSGHEIRALLASSYSSIRLSWHARVSDKSDWYGRPRHVSDQLTRTCQLPHRYTILLSFFHIIVYARSDRDKCTELLVFSGAGLDISSSCHLKRQ